MTGLLISFLIAVFTSAIVLIFGSSLIEAMARRGFNPVERFATILSPEDVRLSLDANTEA